MKLRKHLLGFGLIFLFSMGGFIGCSGDESGNITTAQNSTTTTTTPGSTTTTTIPSTQTELLDATAGGIGAPPTDPRNKYTYLNLSTGQVVDLADADAAASSDWDIAFKRANVKLNSGISGPKGVGGFFVGNNSEAYDSSGDPILIWFQNATADSELPDFEAVDASQIPTASEFKIDQIVPAVLSDGTSDSWWSRDQNTNTVSANSGNWWVVKSAGGNSYIKFHVTDISENTAASISHITMEWQYQAPGEGIFAESSTGDASAYVVDVPLTSGTIYLDFDSQVTGTDPSTLPGWDMRIEYDGTAIAYRITLNGGISGSGSAQAFGPVTAPDNYTTGIGGFTPGQVPIYFSDTAGGIFVESSWYAYNLTGSDNKLWPNYRVYLIKSGTDVYKFQILSYYHPQSTTSAWYTIRFEKIAP